MISKSIIGVVQMTSRSNQEENLQFCSKMISIAVKNQAKLVCFPEGFGFIAEKSASEYATYAEEIPGGSIVSKYCELAKLHKIWLSLGGYQEKNIDDSSKIYNTHFLVNDKGEIIEKYAKTHLFDAKLSETQILQESSYVSPGKTLSKVISSPVGNLGLSICYDLRFPEVYRKYADEKAEIMLIPSAFRIKTGLAHWEVLLRARAIENCCYVIASAQTGVNSERTHTYGHSMVIDPWGKVLLDIQPEEVGIKFVEIDLDYVKTVRKIIPCLDHKRKDLY